MNMNIDFFAQMFADASPLLQTGSSSSANSQFISPNPNTCVSLNQTNSGFTSNGAGLSGVDILDFIPAAAVAEQQQLQQQLQQSQQYLQKSHQSQQYLQTPKSAISSKFQFSGGSNFSTNPTPSFGAIPSFPVNNHDSVINSTSFPVTAQFSPITPNVMNSGSQLNLESYEIHPQQQPHPHQQPHQQQTIFEQNSSTPSSIQGLSNSPLQFSPQQSRFTSASRVSSSNTSVADKSSPTIGLGVSVSVSELSLPNQQVPTSGIVNITNKQPSPHEQAALQFQQQLNHEAHKSSLSNKYVNNSSYSAAAVITTSTLTSSKLQSQLNVELQKLIEQQREKQQQQLLLLKKGEIPKPPELKPKRKSSCRPHKQKRRLQQEQQQQQEEEQQQEQQEQQSQSLRKIPSPPIQSITGDSPTTIEVASPELDVNNELNFSNNTSAFIFGGGGNITAEELLNNDPFETLDGNPSLIDCKDDILSEFINFEYEETIAGDFEKSITKDDFNFLNLNNQDTPIATTTLVESSSSRPVLKKKKSVVSSSSIGNATTSTGSKVSKKSLKKSSSFNGISPPTFIMNPKLQWIKSQTNDQQLLKLMKRSVSNGTPQSISCLGNEDNNDIVQGMPIFTLSNHYLFVYETADTIYQDESNEDSSNQTSPRKQQQQNNNNNSNNPIINEGELLKNLESGLGEFKLDLSKRK